MKNGVKSLNHHFHRLVWPVFDRSGCKWLVSAWTPTSQSLRQIRDINFFDPWGGDDDDDRARRDGRSPMESATGPQAPRWRVRQAVFFLLEIQKIACKLHAITRGFSILHRAMVFVILRKPIKTNGFSWFFIEKPSFTMSAVGRPLPLLVRLGDPWGTLKFDKFLLNPVGALLGLHFFIS